MLRLLLTECNKTRRCVYTDGDSEDLSIKELQKLELAEAKRQNGTGKSDTEKITYEMKNDNIDLNEDSKDQDSEPDDDTEMKNDNNNLNEDSKELCETIVSKDQDSEPDDDTKTDRFSDPKLRKAILTLENEEAKTDEISKEARVVTANQKPEMLPFIYHLMKQYRFRKYSKDELLSYASIDCADLATCGLQCGLQCVHCTNSDEPRHFFHSKALRLYKRIIMLFHHLEECKYCPSSVHRSLGVLKGNESKFEGRMKRITLTKQYVYDVLWNQLLTHNTKSDAIQSEPKFTTKGWTKPISNIENALMYTEYLESRMQDEKKMSNVQIVSESDRALLNDFGFVTMNQYIFCRYNPSSEAQKPRANFKGAPGHGGLACIHCSKSARPKRFYFGTEQRLKRKFSFLYLHLMDCRQCPQQLKDSLQFLKQNTAEYGLRNEYLDQLWKKLSFIETQASLNNEKIYEKSPIVTISMDIDKSPSKSRVTNHQNDDKPFITISMDIDKTPSNSKIDVSDDKILWTDLSDSMDITGSEQSLGEIPINSQACRKETDFTVINENRNTTESSGENEVFSKISINNKVERQSHHYVKTSKSVHNTGVKPSQTIRTSSRQKDKKPCEVGDVGYPFSKYFPGHGLFNGMVVEIISSESKFALPFSTLRRFYLSFSSYI